MLLSVLAIVIGSFGWFAKIRGLEKLKIAGATSSETAKSFEEAGLSRYEKICLIISGEAKSTKDGGYYLPCEEKK